MVFRGGRVFDGTGAAPADADVVFEDGRIVEVGTGLDGDEAIDVRRQGAAPGSVRLPHPPGDALRGLRRVRARCTSRSRCRSTGCAENLRRTLALGITTVRDASGADAGLRVAVEEGTLVGPRMQVERDDALDDRGAQRSVAAERRAGAVGRRVPGHAIRGLRRRRRGDAQGARGDPRGRRRRSRSRPRAGSSRRPTIRRSPTSPRRRSTRSCARRRTSGPG